MPDPEDPTPEEIAALAAVDVLINDDLYREYGRDEVLDAFRAGRATRTAAPAAARIRTALAGLDPVPGEDGDVPPRRWYVEGIHGDNEVRSIAAADLTAVLDAADATADRPDPVLAAARLRAELATMQVAPYGEARVETADLVAVLDALDPPRS